MSKIHSKAFLAWLTLAGIVPTNCRRVVIDANPTKPLMIYAELYGTSEMISVEPPPDLHAARIFIAGKPVEGGESGVDN